MNPETDPVNDSTPRRASEFSPSFLRWLISLTCGTLVLFFVIDPLYRGRPFGEIGFSPYPWIVAGGQVISFGLQEFSGRPLEVPTATQRYSLLASLLVGLVVGPTLFFFGWRMNRIEKESGKKGSVFRASNIAFLLGVLVTFTIAVPAIPAAIAQRMVSHSLRNAQAVQRSRDAIINDLNWIRLFAEQHRALPQEGGGGGGTYIGFQIPSQLEANAEATYEIVNVFDSTVVMKASSKRYDAGVMVTIDGRFARRFPAGLRDWTYTGQFQ